jgi:hypothetical protein
MDIFLFQRRSWRQGSSHFFTRVTALDEIKAIKTVMTSSTKICPMGQADRQRDAASIRA